MPPTPRPFVTPPSPARLETLSASSSLSSRPQIGAARLRRWLKRRHQTAAGVVLGVLLAMPGLIPGVTPLAHAAQTQLPSRAAGDGTPSQATATSSLPPEIAQQFDEALSSAYSDVAFPGAVAGVYTPQGDWVAAIGVQDTATGEPMTTDVHQRIGSLTKTFTVTLLLQLMQEGKLSLDDPISRYVNGVPNGNAITLRNLANMTSGLVSYSNDPTWQERYFGSPTSVWTPDQLLGIALAQPVQFAPGTHWDYSNTNTILLGTTIERITGQSLGDAYRSRIIDPLGLSQTSFPDSSAAFPTPHARGYTNQTLDGQVVDATDWNPSWGWSAGEMISTLDDLHRYVHALGTGEGLLQPATQQLRLASFLTKLPPNTPEKAYGLGLGIGSGWLGHTGELPGFNTVGYYNPKLDATVVVMVNSDIAKDNQNPAPAVFERLAAALGAPISN
jgi:D-alanyl-D-alanine carboxypeptidase